MKLMLARGGEEKREEEGDNGRGLGCNEREIRENFMKNERMERGKGNHNAIFFKRGRKEEIERCCEISVREGKCCIKHREKRREEKVEKNSNDMKDER